MHSKLINRFLYSSTFGTTQAITPSSQSVFNTLKSLNIYKILKFKAFELTNHLSPQRREYRNPISPPKISNFSQKEESQTIICRELATLHVKMAKILLPSNYLLGMDHYLKAAKFIGLNEIETGKIFSALGDMAKNEHATDQAIDFYREAIAQYKQSDSPSQTQLFTLYQIIGSICLARGQTLEAVENYLNAIRYHEESSYGNDTTELYITLGDFYVTQNSRFAAIECYCKALKHCIEKENDEQTVKLSLLVAAQHQQLENYENALKYWQQALNTGQVTELERLQVLISLGFAYEKLNKYEEASKTLKQALKLQKKQQLTSQLGYLYEKIGNLQRLSGDFAKSTWSFEQMLKAYAKLEGTESILYLNGLDRMASHEILLSNWQKAFGYYEQIMELLQKYSLRLDFLNDYSKKSLIFRSINNILVSSTKFQQATLDISLIETTLVPFFEHSALDLVLSSQISKIFSLLGSLKIRNQDYEKALEYYRKSLLFAKQGGDVTSQNLFKMNEGLIKVCIKHSMYEAALQEIDRTIFGYQNINGIESQSIQRLQAVKESIMQKMKPPPKEEIISQQILI